MQISHSITQRTPAICLPQPQCFLSQPSGKQNLQPDKPSCKHNKERSILVFPGDFYQKSSNKCICKIVSFNKMNFPPPQIPLFIYVHVKVFHTLKITKLFEKAHCKIQLPDQNYQKQGLHVHKLNELNECWATSCLMLFASFISLANHAHKVFLFFFQTLFSFLLKQPVFIAAKIALVSCSLII